MKKFDSDLWIFILFLFIEIGSIVILFIHDWKIGLLVFLICWSGNVQNHLKRKAMPVTRVVYRDDRCE